MGLQLHVAAHCSSLGFASSHLLHKPCPQPGTLSLKVPLLIPEKVARAGGQTGEVAGLEAS